MNYDKIKEFSMISAVITSGLESMFQAQYLLVDMMCRECDMPLEMKEQILNDMNKVIGVKKI